MDGEPVQGDSALAQALAAHKPGDQVTLTVVRGSQQSRVSMTLGTAA
jgi:S1-C subfamily serine protease